MSEDESLTEAQARLMREAVERYDEPGCMSLYILLTLLLIVAALAYVAGHIFVWIGRT